MIFLPLRSASELDRRSPCGRRTAPSGTSAFWLLIEMYMATPGFLRLAFMPSIVTSTAEASIWLVISAATFGGPPISRIISGSMFCSLKKPRSSATKYGSDELTGNTPTLTLSCAAAGSAASTIAATRRQQRRRAICVHVAHCDSLRFCRIVDASAVRVRHCKQVSCRRVIRPHRRWRSPGRRLAGPGAWRRPRRTPPDRRSPPRRRRRPRPSNGGDDARRNRRA